MIDQTAGTTVADWVLRGLAEAGCYDLDALVWAFGKQIGPEQNVTDLMHLWNREHPELFTIRPQDEFPRTMKKIGMAYMKFKSQPKDPLALAILQAAEMMGKQQGELQ